MKEDNPASMGTNDESNDDLSESVTSNTGETMDMVWNAFSQSESSRTPISAVDSQVDLGFSRSQWLMG